MASEELSVPTSGSQARSLTKVMTSAQFLTWTALALMTVSSVASLRPAPTMAVYGLSSVFLYLIPAIVFLVPTALVAAELASGWNGGVYRWVTEGISPRFGFLAVWCQFAMTIFYYPSLLAFVASTLAYVINPELASSGVWTAAVIIGFYWLGVLVSSQGTKMLAGLASKGVIIGTLIPGTLLIILGVTYLLQGNPSAAPMTAEFIIPAWTGIASLVLIVNNFLSYSGMEMNAVHVSELKDPPKEFPKGMFLAMGLVLIIFILPALAISWVVPAEALTLTAGLMQAFEAFFNYFEVGWLTPIIGLMILTASLGGMLTWLAGPSKGLLLIGRREGYIPPFFQKMNKNGIQQNILVVQGFVTTVIGLAYAFIPDVSSAYWIFSVMTTQVYLIMYVLMFIAAIQLRRHQPEQPRGYRAPALTLLCIVGLVASAMAIVIGFVPPSQFSGGSTVTYFAIVGGGVLLIGLIVPGAFYAFRKPSWKSPDAELAEEEALAPPAPTVPAEGAPAAAAGFASAAAAAQGGADTATSGAEPASSGTGGFDPEHDPTPDQPKRHKFAYAIAGVALLALAIWGVASIDEKNENEDAQAKATELIGAFEAAGLPAPSQQFIVDALGDDGGQVCEDPSGTLLLAQYKQNLAQGGAHVGQRPVIIDDRIIQGQLLILETYCPDEVEDVRQELEDLETDDTINQ